MQTRSRPEVDPGAILWDGFGLQTLYSGVGRHAWDLHEALSRTQNLTPRIIPSVPTIDSHFSPYIAEQKATLPKSRIKPWALLWAGQWLRRFREDFRGPLLVHGLSNYNLPAIRQKGIRKVLTVHDLIPIIRREDVSAALGLYLRYQLPKALAAADAIICVSHWTEATLHERYPESRNRTLVIPNGFPRFSAAPKTQEKPQILTISRTETYKRLGFIGAILRHLPADLQWTVVTDARGQELLQNLQDSRLVVRTQVSDTELRTLHRETSVYVHPSLYEGFCLPAADSISHGVPVVHTLGSGIDEVVDGAGFGLSDVADGKQWADAIQSLLANPDSGKLCQSRCDIAASWEDVAASTRALYDKLGGR